MMFDSDKEAGRHSRRSLWCKVAAGAVLIGVAGSGHSAPRLAFKDLELGVSQKTVAKSRKLNCFDVKPHVYSQDVPESRSIRREEARLSLYASSGDTWCTVAKPGTVGGMKIAEMRLVFLEKTLGEIHITVDERGKSTPDGRGSGIWHSDDITTLADTLVGRYGPAQRQQYTDCSGRRGRCRGAPLKNVLSWNPDGGKVVYTYWEDTVSSFPSLVMTSNEFTTKQAVLKIKSNYLKRKADAIEFEVSERRRKARSSDI